jgi:hypothetical protein
LFRIAPSGRAQLNTIDAQWAIDAPEEYGHEHTAKDAYGNSGI